MIGKPIYSGGKIRILLLGIQSSKMGLREVIKGIERVFVGASIPTKEKIKFKALWTIEKFRGDYKSREEAIKVEGKPYEVLKFEGNVLLNEGIQQILDDICGLATVTKWDNANARVGVGDGTIAEDPTQTGLQGVNTAYVGMDAGYPSRSAQTVTFRGTFDGATGNFAWEEVTVDNGSVALINLNRKVQSLGTKASGTTWVLTLELTIS